MLRIKLVGTLVDLESIVTGIVCAVLGSEEKDGTFLVSSSACKNSIKSCLYRKNLTLF